MPRHRRPAPSITRRGVLVTGALVAATGAGVAAGLLRPQPPQAASLGVPPPELARALAREQQLIAGLDAALRHDTSLAAALGQVRGDHVGHAQALRSTLASYPGGTGLMAPGPASSGPASSGPASSGPVAPSPGQASPSLAQLSASEADAARLAAGDALNLDGAAAALLASISASEAGHAELLG